MKAPVGTREPAFRGSSGSGLRGRWPSPYSAVIAPGPRQLRSNTPAERGALVQEIVRLDADYQARRLSRERYLQRRFYLKEKLLVLEMERQAAGRASLEDAP